MASWQLFDATRKPNACERLPLRVICSMDFAAYMLDEAFPTSNGRSTTPCDYTLDISSTTYIEHRMRILPHNSNIKCVLNRTLHIQSESDGESGIGANCGSQIWNRSQISGY
jgi:hypothetical protein